MIIEKTTKAGIKTLLAVIFIALTACSATDLKPTNNASKHTKVLPDTSKEQPQAGKNPPMTVTKDGKELQLVKIMDGGVCKNELEGAKGTFLIYADQADIERIKHEKGAKIFQTYEKKIETFSSDVLQQVVEQTNLGKNPFALDEEDAQQKLAGQFTENFQKAIAKEVIKFQRETTLTLDIRAYPSSFIFYQQGCKATQMDNEEPSNDDQII